MRTKVTLVLLFLNVALFFFIFRLERAWRTEGVALEVRHRVLGAEAADIRTLAVENTASGSSYRLEKRRDGWMLTEPWEWRANPSAVDRILSDLQFLNDETSFSVHDVENNGQKLADYGLAQPALSVTFVSGGPETTGRPPVTTTLRIGSSTKVGQRLYLLSPDGTRIHVVGRSLAESLSLPLAQLRSDAVLTIPVFEARSLSVRTPAGSRVLIQRDVDGSRWAFETPVSARANKDAIELAINGLDSLRVKSFPGPNLPLPPPSGLQLTLEGDRRRETLFLGTDVEGQPAAGADGAREVYGQLEDLTQASGRSVLFTVSMREDLRATLVNAVETLRDPHLLDFDASAVTGITLHGPGAPDLVLQRLEPAVARAPGTPAAGNPPAGWEVVLPGETARGTRVVRADGDAVQRLLSQLALLSARQYFDAPTDANLESWGFNRPERRITLTLPAPAPPVTLEIGRSNPRDPVVYARLANVPAGSVYAVAPDILGVAAMQPRDWRDRQLRVRNASTITALALADLQTGKVQKIARDSPLGRELAEQLQNLHARRFIADTFTPSGTGGIPWRYRLDATFAEPSGGAAETTVVQTVLPLFLEERSGGAEQAAGAPGDIDAVFVPDQPLVDALWRLIYADRDPGEAPPASK